MYVGTVDFETMTKDQTLNWLLSDPIVCKLVVVDVDGCLTDGNVIYNDDGTRARVFSVIDGYGFELLGNHEFDVLILSGENDGNIRQRAAKLGVSFMHSKGDKKKALESYIRGNYVNRPEIYSIGDDVTDLSIFDTSVFSTCPKNSIVSKKFPERVDMILSRPGGNGAFREFVEAVLTSNQIDPYYNF